MRVVMLVRWSAWQVQAVNRMHREFGLTAVYFEGRKPRQRERNRAPLFMRIWKQRALLGQPRALAAYLYSTIKQRIMPSCTHGTVKREYSHQVYTQLFSDPWDRVVDPSLPVITVEEKGWDASKIERWSPDILVVFGTSILPPEIIAIPSRGSLNLHWGLSPYYRGSHCTDWAILNNDLKNVGVTIHLVDPSIDTGPILAQARPDVVPSDTPFSIDMKLSVLGVDLLQEVLSAVEGGKCLLVRPQKWLAGRTYYMKEWTGGVERRLAGKLQRGCVAPLLRKEQGGIHGILPSVRLTQVACQDTQNRFVVGEMFPDN